MKPSERIEQIARKFRNDGVAARRNDLQAVVDYLDEQHEAAELAERQRIQRAMHDTFGSMGRDTRATAKNKAAAETLSSLLEHWAQMTPERAKRGIETALKELEEG